MFAGGSRGISVLELFRLFIVGQILAVGICFEAKADLFPLTIVHINDFHARYEETNPGGGECKPQNPCIDGYARLVYTIRKILREQSHTNPIYLNAGDNFQGTLWYNIGRWNVTTQFLNMLPADAIVLGNHEFDHDIDGVVPYLENINSPIVVANINDSLEPRMQNKYNRSIIIERGQRKIGIIGVIISATNEMASTGKLTFRNESDAIREEAAKLKEQGVNIIIVVSHCGYDVDQVIAHNLASEIDVIVGGHSHTFLYTGDKQPGPDRPGGPYPTEIVDQFGNRVLIVQAAAYAKYVGNITVYFNDEGKVVNYEGAPIYMSTDVKQDEQILKALEPWKEIVDKEGNIIIGVSKVDMKKFPCSHTECNLGNYFCDAIIHTFVSATPYTSLHWTTVAIGLVNTGGLRTSLSRGNLTYSNIVTMSPFENIIVSFDLPAIKLLEALEFAVSKIDLENNITSSAIFLQVAGLKVVYDYSQPPYSRVIDLQVRCRKCIYPYYEPFDIQETYRIAAPSFLQTGGDGYHMFRDFATNVRPHTTDLDALLEYTKVMSPLYIGTSGRIIVL